VTKFELNQCLLDLRDILSKLRAWLLYYTTFEPLQFLFKKLTKFGVNECLWDPRNIGVVPQAWPLWSPTFKQLRLFFIFFTQFGLNKWLLDPLVLSLRRDLCVAKPSNNSILFCYFLTNFGLKECLSDPRDIDVALEAWPLWSSTFREVHLNIIFWRYLGWTNVSRIRET
jgi:hypothetical protein